MAIDKFVTVQQTDFWEKAFLVALPVIGSVDAAAKAADVALARRQERMSYELNELEKLHGEDEGWED